MAAPLAMLGEIRLARLPLFSSSSCLGLATAAASFSILEADAEAMAFFTVVKSNVVVVDIEEAS